MNRKENFAKIVSLNNVEIWKIEGLIFFRKLITFKVQSIHLKLNKKCYFI